MYRKYWSQIPPLRPLRAKAPQLDLNFSAFYTFFFFPPSIPACMKRHMAKNTQVYCSPPPPPPLMCDCQRPSCHFPTDIQQSLVEEVISGEIAFGLYTSATAVCLFLRTGSALHNWFQHHSPFFFSPPHSPLAPKKMGIRCSPNIIKVHWLWTTLQCWHFKNYVLTARILLLHINNCAEIWGSSTNNKNKQPKSV